MNVLALPKTFFLLCHSALKLALKEVKGTGEWGRKIAKKQNYLLKGQVPNSISANWDPDPTSANQDLDPISPNRSLVSLLSIQGRAHPPPLDPAN